MNQIIHSATLSDLKAKELKLSGTILLVTGKKSYISCGAKEHIDRLLSGCEVIHFSDFRANPLLEDLNKGLSLVRGKRISRIIAVGGGSVMDMAKLIKATAFSEHAPEEYIYGKQQLSKDNLPELIAIPTTSGSGSESTHFAVVYIGDVKYSLAHRSLLPDEVILDPGLTLSADSYQTACSGLDALAQSVESMWNVNATAESLKISEKALNLALSNLIPAVLTPTLENHRDMQLASNLAGQAINITKTTGAHAFCYFLTSHYDIPHGNAAALMLAPFFVFNDPNNEANPVFQKLYEIMGVSTAEEASLSLLKMMDECKVPSRLSSVMNIEKDFDDFYKAVNLERLKNNPRDMNNGREEFFKLLLKY